MRVRVSAQIGRYDRNAGFTLAEKTSLDLNEQPVWPEDERHRPALYLWRIVVGRSYAGCRLGAALLDWTADMAKRDYGAALIRIDVWDYQPGRYTPTTKDSASPADRAGIYGNSPTTRHRHSSREPWTNQGRTTTTTTTQDCSWKKNNTE